MAYSAQSTPSVSTSQNEPQETVHHTVTACVRCRQRKTRCDPSVPRCGPCERSDSHCEYFDSIRNQTISRTYITSLQEKVRRLSEELRELVEKEKENYQPNHEEMVRSGTLVKFSENEERRYLGPSSGITITRYIMEFAKKNYARRTIKEVVPSHAAEEIKHKFDVESSKPTSKVYPLISSVAAPDLPNRDLMERLLQIYMVKVQYQSPVLHEPTFRENVQAVYEGAEDCTLNFQVRLVIAISMQKLDTQYAGLADSYYLAALSYLEDVIRKKDVSTLQCFALIAEYSLLTPTRTASYWVVGLAAKLCQDLGLCHEETIDKSPSGLPLNVLEVDMRRRMFWIISLLEYGLAHTLGRPSAFGVSVDNVNVGFYELCDDRFITAQGIEPGHRPVMQKCIAVHICRMRLLQAEIRRTLYLRKRETPVHDQDPWFQYMLEKIDEWVRDSPRNDEGSGMSETWFKGRCNAMIVSMYRPSPQIPVPSFEAACRCYDAATFIIRVQRTLLETQHVDITWVFTIVMFAALNTVLWSISYPGIRHLHPQEEVQDHIQDAIKAIEVCADRWPGVRSAQQLHENLIRGCLKAYELDRAGESPTSEQRTPSTAQDSGSPISQNTYNSPGTSNTSNFEAQSPASVHQNYLKFDPSSMSSNGITNERLGLYQSNVLDEAKQPYKASTSRSTSLGDTAYNLPILTQQNYTHYIPTTSQTTMQWNALQTPGNFDTTYATTEADFTAKSWLPSFGDEYSQYLHQAFGVGLGNMPTLSHQQQIELMSSLEQSQLPDVSQSTGYENAFYTPYLP